MPKKRKKLTEPIDWGRKIALAQMPGWVATARLYSDRGQELSSNVVQAVLKLLRDGCTLDDVRASNPPSALLEAIHRAGVTDQNRSALQSLTDIDW